jgi:hypothetical protein
MRRPAGAVGFRGASDAAIEKITHETAKHAEWKARALALEQQIDAILTQLGQAGINWAGNSTPQQIANAIGAINLIHGLQDVSQENADHVEDLQNLVRDIIAGLEQERDASIEQSIKTLYDKLIAEIRKELQTTEAPYAH